MSLGNITRAGYKNADAGRIPDGWKIVRLADICEVKGGKRLPKGFTLIKTMTSHPYIRVADMENGSVSLKNILYVPDEIWPAIKNYTISSNDLYISVAGSLGLVGKIPVQLENANLTENADKLTNIQAHIDFLYHILSSSIVQKHIDGVRTTSAQPKLALERIREFKIPYPPIGEQQCIAQILSTWDRAIEHVQRLIEAKQRQKDQLVSQLLSGQKRFPGFQDEWNLVKLGAFLHPKFRKVVKPSGAYLRLGIRSHGKGTFTSVVDDPETIALTHLFQVRKDDLIVNITFAWEGAIALVGPDGDGALVSHRFPTYVFDTSKMLPEYFKHLMVTERFFYELDLISPGGAGRNRVMNKGDFLKITVTIPGVEEQKKIASVLGGMDEQIALLKKYLERLKEQKKGLMQKLLTGEIRVKVD